MTENNRTWPRFSKWFAPCHGTGISLDISRMAFEEDWLVSMSDKISDITQAMRELELGGIANPDEGRMVGHYWLRNPELAPSTEIRNEIHDCYQDILSFASKVRTGAILAENGEPFRQALILGIGGSALGPQLVYDALAPAEFGLKLHFCDNTDPEGITRTLLALKDDLPNTLFVTISKSGGTIETRNAMLETMHFLEQNGVDFAARAIAVTQNGSKLHQLAKTENWLVTFPLWDWVGGRTSLMSAVGLLPMALSGIDTSLLLSGARQMDILTRYENIDPERENIPVNPALWLALMWLYAGNGKGDRDMVVIPYKDRLVLFSKYLQQLVMESLGKARDLSGELVEQGITVYGNKGSTDQHAYIQQLRDGVNNFFVTFIEVLRDNSLACASPVEVEPDVTSGDYLLGFMLGTREALSSNNRESITITLEEVSPKTLGAMIALYERAVGYYALLVNINAYHQPGVEAGKKAAQLVISLQREILTALKDCAKESPLQSAYDIAELIGQPSEAETTYKILEHLASNPIRFNHGWKIERENDQVRGPSETRYRVIPC